MLKILSTFKNMLHVLSTYFHYSRMLKTKHKEYAQLLFHTFYLLANQIIFVGIFSLHRRNLSSPDTQQIQLPLFLESCPPAAAIYGLPETKL